MVSDKTQAASGLSGYCRITSQPLNNHYVLRCVFHMPNHFGEKQSQTLSLKTGLFVLEESAFRKH